VAKGGIAGGELQLGDDAGLPFAVQGIVQVAQLIDGQFVGLYGGNPLVEGEHIILYLSSGKGFAADDAFPYGVQFVLAGSHQCKQRSKRGRKGKDSQKSHSVYFKTSVL